MVPHPPDEGAVLPDEAPTISLLMFTHTECTNQHDFFSEKIACNFILQRRNEACDHRNGCWQPVSTVIAAWQMYFKCPFQGPLTPLLIVATIVNNDMQFQDHRKTFDW